MIDLSRGRPTPRANVGTWSGSEVRALREAKRLTVEEFAASLGVSPRIVSKWEAGGRTKQPRPTNQEALDTLLASSSVDVHARFVAVTEPQRPELKLNVPSNPLHAPTGQVPALVPDPGRGSSDEVAVQAPAGKFFTGTSIPVRAYPANHDGRILAAVPAGFVDDPFLQIPGRGLVVGITEDEHGVNTFGLDSRQARRRMGGAPDQARLLMPRAYRLDDLTLGVLWAVANFDEALLDDDATLAATQGQLHVYEQSPRSAVGREIAADLAPVSRMWLGSQFCASHIQRHSKMLTDVPAFWTREQRGEEASTWLLFSHKYTYLCQSGGTDSGLHGAPTRAFCIPPSAVTESGRPERILLLLAMALMESFGIAVDVSAEPEYAAVPGFVFDGHRQAILASWFGTDGVWQVDVTDTSSLLSEFADATAYARAHTVAPHVMPGERLRALAAYLELDWAWLVRRCGELGEYGSGGIARPRSRLLSTDGVDRACRFVARTAQLR